MIVIKIELHSAITGQVSLLWSAVLINDGTGDAKRGNYDLLVGRKDDAANLLAVRERPLRRGYVSDWPRLSYNVWRLVLKALASAFPEQRVSLPDADNIESEAA